MKTHFGSLSLDHTQTLTAAHLHTFSGHAFTTIHTTNEDVRTWAHSTLAHEKKNDELNNIEKLFKKKKKMVSILSAPTLKS